MKEFGGIVAVGVQRTFRFSVVLILLIATL